MGKSLDRPFLIFRQSRQNRYTIPVLLGALERENLIDEFDILLARSVEEIPSIPPSSGMIIAFSFMTPQLESILEEIRQLRRSRLSRAIFLAGGPHPTADPQGTARLGFDFVFIGEGERSLPGFLRRFLAGTLPSDSLIQSAAPIELDDYPPFPSKGKFFSPIEITRGCLYRCAFCQTPRIFGPPLRHRSPKGLKRLIQKAASRGYGQAFFRSPNAFAYCNEREAVPNLPAMEELFQVCFEGGVRRLHFGCFPSEVRPDWVTAEALSLVRKYCSNRTIVLGAQSGSDALLSRLGRRHTALQALQACQTIRQCGFTPHVDFVFGFPGETAEDRQRSLSLMERMILEHGARIHAHTYLPLPGTPLFGETPSSLDESTRRALIEWEKKGKLDGWWREQEEMAWKIIRWRDEGMIQSLRGNSFTLDTSQFI
jgi:B12-binding domain/radical SAM domain protein